MLEGVLHYTLYYITHSCHHGDYINGCWKWLRSLRLLYLRYYSGALHWTSAVPLCKIIILTELVMLDTNFIQFYFDKNVAKSFLKMWGKWRYHGMGEAGRRCQEMAPKPFYARVDIHISPHGCTHTQRKLKWKTRNALWGGNLKLNIRFYSSSCVWGSVV